MLKNIGVRRRNRSRRWPRGGRWRAPPTGGGNRPAAGISAHPPGGAGPRRRPAPVRESAPSRGRSRHPAAPGTSRAAPRVQRVSTRLQILRDVFGFDAFRPGQEDVVADIEAGTDVLAVMPTGAGKSLCYQVPALALGGLTVVVSPLTALMDDQVARLRQDGVAAAAIHSGQPRDEQIANWRAAARGDVRLLYMSPERLMTDRMIAALRRLGPVMFVVDEAHCVSKWGPSFRPEYEQLTALRDAFPGARMAAFTATADATTRDDVVAALLRPGARVHVRGFDRPNLRLAVAERGSWKEQLAGFLADKRDVPGIVYCLSRAFTDEVAEHLRGEGVNAIAYHAGLDQARRREAQDRFMSDRAVVMVATIAFGMGIDKPDIRYVCHLNLPGSVEAYYQEIGRAGRDGAPAETLLLYGLADIRMRRLFIEDDGTDGEHKRRENRRLDALVAYCETPGCRRVALLGYFDEAVGPCGNCDNCLDPPVTIDATREARALLAAIRQTGSSFGQAHVIDVLRGADTDKIRARGHQGLDAHGAGADRDRPFWQTLVRQALADGVVTLNVARYGRLEWGPRAAGVAEGDAVFRMRTPRPQRTRARGARAAFRATPADVDEGLLGALKALRLELARDAGVPAYVVFPDSTLIEMARERPGTLADMAGIAGVGPQRLERYGPAFLDVLAGAPGGA
ncbi:MAG: DNA helicase RecQ [Thermoleophilia bacterium]|nr:DNA helicase RecQ [Thermoleophilia bacterium]